MLVAEIDQIVVKTEQVGVQRDATPSSAGAPARPRLGPPPLVYRGTAEEHWRGQGCYPVPSANASPGYRDIVLACGCSGHVPAWTVHAR